MTATLHNLADSRPAERKPAPTHPALMALMSHIPVQAFVGPRGTLVNMFTAGEGMPVLAVHGSAMQGSAWRGLQEQLGEGFRFHCPDLYGYGRSEALPMPQRMTVEDNAGLVSALLRRFDRPAHLVGHAFGAAVLLRAALENPGKVASMTLYEPLALHLLKPELGGHAPAQRQVESMAADIRAACLRGHSHLGAEVFYDFCNGAGAFGALPQSRRAHLASQAPRLCLDIAMAFQPRQSLTSYMGLRMPVLLLSGARSPGAIRVVTERLAGVLPMVRHAILPDLSHFAPMSQPDTVARVIRPFLQACQRMVTLRDCA